MIDLPFSHSVIFVQMCDGRLPKPKGDHSVVSQKGSNYFLGLILTVSHRYAKKMGGKLRRGAFLSLKLFTDALILRAAPMVQWLIDSEIDSH